MLVFYLWAKSVVCQVGFLVLQSQGRFDGTCLRSIGFIGAKHLKIYLVVFAIHFFCYVFATMLGIGAVGVTGVSFEMYFTLSFLASGFYVFVVGAILYPSWFRERTLRIGAG